MPIFEYECKKCSHKFDIIYLPGEEEKPKCPKCDSEEVEKLISAAGIRPHGIPKGRGGFSVPSCMNREHERKI